MKWAAQNEAVKTLKYSIRHSWANSIINKSPQIIFHISIDVNRWSINLERDQPWLSIYIRRLILHVTAVVVSVVQWCKQRT